jgi:outer membrane lipoprotein-sorting protein
MPLIFLLFATAGLLDPLTARLEDSVFLTGDFVQTDTWALTLETGISRGVMYLAHPNLFRLDFADPPGRITGCDGASVYTVEPLYSEVIVYGNSSPEGFLHLLRRAGDEGMDISGETADGLVTVTVRGDLGGGISTLRVRYSVSDSLPDLFYTSDVNGNTTEWALSGLETRRQVPEGLFDMPVPDGYSVVSGDE